jgi:hypothetical protein
LFTTVSVRSAMTIESQLDLLLGVGTRVRVDEVPVVELVNLYRAHTIADFEECGESKLDMVRVINCSLLAV